MSTSEPVKTPIVDKNGKQTTVLKKPDDISSAHPRLTKLMNTPSIFVDDVDYAESAQEVTDRLLKGVDNIGSLIVGNRNRDDIARLSEKLLAVLDGAEMWEKFVEAAASPEEARDAFIKVFRPLASGNIATLSPASVEGYKLAMDYVKEIHTNEPK